MRTFQISFYFHDMYYSDAWNIDQTFSNSLIIHNDDPIGLHPFGQVHVCW